MTDKILAHFHQADPIIHTVMKTHGVRDLQATITPQEYFLKLSQDIIGQQLSVKVADVITTRFMALFPSQVFTPEAVLAIPDDQLRAVGLSWNKVKYIKALAAHTMEGRLPFSKFTEMDNETIVAELTKVKGIGQWTAEMFLMFTMARPDVFSKGDLGLRRGMQKLYELSEAEWFERVDDITIRWQPYRTYGAMAVWRSLTP
jgi:DNA-3-methyladenine glycosylase II